MKIFVTGATGKVGSRFVPYLLKQGHAVRILVRNAERALELKELGAEVIEGDLLDNENLTKVIQGVDAVIHIAAQFRGGISEEVARAVNLDATITLAKASLEAGVTRFVFTSTGNVYRDISVNRLCREDDILMPAKLIYPKTKIAAEEALLRLHREQGLDIRIMRLAFVYGDGDPHIEEILPYMINWYPLKKQSMVHHEDVSQALLLAASTPGIGGRIYNVADDNPIAIGELYKLYGGPEQVPTKDGWLMTNLWELTADTERIKNELNFRPKYHSIYTARDMGTL
ncbi:NAD-dependent epimerase/dehydratase family protein [Clostridium sp. 'White wine YQ']|uniref:NAD-dependent epimerase/dehydratase family protein n=1 Tax=Clostridium sp. 'White wine YQ' TaxID=3027474 RepID=UPI002366507C|nr:NAD(P)-dependent oxidoreductase [Clostridium sp. 'White wine YQ']MDD7795534.1 NAD(P)-dependent oxidoreductase [Clostridium sp. 'White wine YQ']